MNTEILNTFLFYNMLINIILLTLFSILMMLLKNVVPKQHAKLFNLKEEIVMPMIYGYLGAYKIFVIVFAIVPYIAFKIAIG